jgi:uncharacterized protein (TIGR00369 family)
MSIPQQSAGPDSPDAVLDAARVQELIDVRFPQLQAGGRSFVIEDAGPRRARVRMRADPRNTRPGGTVSGPAMFALADFSVYVAIIASLGEPGVDAVTSSLTINFLARPEPCDMIAAAKLIRLGRRLGVGEVELYSDGVPEFVAHAVATYALPAVK